MREGRTLLTVFSMCTPRRATRACERRGAAVRIAARERFAIIFPVVVFNGLGVEVGESKSGDRRPATPAHVTAQLYRLFACLVCSLQDL